MSSSDPVAVTSHKQLSVQSVEKIAARFRVIADPARVRIMEALDRGEATPATLARRIGLAEEVLSPHLEVLFQAGVVRLRDGGRFALIDWTDWWFVQQMARALEPPE